MCCIYTCTRKVVTMKTDTIAAIATGLSASGISVIRISGDNALDIIDRIFYKKRKDINHENDANPKISEKESHTVNYGFIYDGDTLIDEVMVLLMKAPRSYTRENVVEIDCHGGVIVTKKILETVIKYGARPAEPGEFTKRAFLNGRIDLSQAEAVIDILNAKNEYALKNSMNQLKGNILEKIKEIRANIIRDVAFIEAALDDPEHISIDHFGDELYERCDENLKDLTKLLENSDNGRIIHEGIKTVILGKPNAGKSSLLNNLLKEDRAIVTDIAGTTRDTLEETINLNGLCLNIIDTAGIRSTEDIVEKIGVNKAKEVAEDADLIIYVVDASRELDSNDHEIIELIQTKKAIVLLNKIDLNMVIDKKQMEELTQKPVIEISAKESIGITELEEKIKNMFFEGKISFNDEIYITNVRHKTAIQDGITSIQQVKDSINAGMPEDFYSIDLMNAYEVLGEIIGESVGEDLVNTIFSEFCMGK